MTVTDPEVPTRAALPVEIPPLVREWDAKAQHVTTPLAKGRLVWRRWGSGPPVVLVHGGSGSWTHWIRTIPALSQHYTVWAVDLAGHGDSDALSTEDLKLLPGEETDFVDPVNPTWQPQPAPMPAIARNMVHALETIIPEGKITLVGFSFGAMVSSNIAARIPQRIDRVILCGAAGVTTRNSAKPQLLSWRRAGTPERLADVQRKNLAIQMLHDPVNIDDLTLNIQIINTRRTQARKPDRKGSTLAMLRKARDESGVRIGAIWGEFDATSCHELAEIPGKLREIDPNADFRVIKGSGHWVAHEYADDFNRNLLDMLKH